VEAARLRAEEEERERERRRVVLGPWAEGVRVVVVAGEVPQPPPPLDIEEEAVYGVKDEAMDSASGPREAAIAEAVAAVRHEREGDDAAEEYTISRILNHKNIMGTNHFLCAWEGLPGSKATWLTEDELEGADDIIAEYCDRFEQDAEQYASGGGEEESDEDESAGEESNGSGPDHSKANGTGEENGVLGKVLEKAARRPSMIDDWVLSISPGWEEGRQTNGMVNGTSGSSSSPS
jgi:hypothetical protein